VEASEFSACGLFIALMMEAVNSKTSVKISILYYNCPKNLKSDGNVECVLQNCYSQNAMPPEMLEQIVVVINSCLHAVLRLGRV
jgi:hypothetical protein